MVALILRRRRCARIAALEYALSPSTRPGRVRGRPGPGRAIVSWPISGTQASESWPCPAQVSRADHWAAAAGLTVETTTRTAQASLVSVSNWATAAAAGAALVVLAMTIGLIRTETAGNLRVLAATGAGSRTRSLITGATAAALALLGALLGTAAVYLAIIAWNRRIHSLAQVPVRNLAALIVGLPVAALVAGWLLAGREPSAIARQPLD